MSTDRSTDRVTTGPLLGLLALLALAPAATAQQAEPGEPEQQAQQIQEPDPDRPGARDLGQVPGDPSLPGEPPAAVDPLDQEESDEADDSDIGSFFLTTFSLASAYDRSERVEAAEVPGPGVDVTTNDDGRISYLVRPTFLLVHKPNARGGLVVAYEPELETFQDDGSFQDDADADRERVSHSAGLVYDRRTSRRTDITAGASYLDSLDPSRHLGGEGFVLIPGRLEQSRAFFGASHLWPRATRLHFYSEYSSTTSDLDATDTALDLQDLSGTVALEQGIGRRSDITFSYSYTESEVETLDSALPAPETFSGPVDAFRVGFGHRADGGFSFHLSGGALREHASASRGLPIAGEDELPSADEEDELSWIGGAEVARETDTLRLRLRYDRSLFAFGYGNAEAPSGIEDAVGSGAVLRDTVSDTVAFSLELVPHHRVRLEQALWLSRQSVLESDDIESFVSGTQVEVLLTGRNVHRLLLFSRLDYFDRGESTLLGDDLSRTRFSLGFRVGLSGPQTKVGHELALTELRKVLPTGGRL